MMEKNTLFCYRCELSLYYGFGLDLTNFELGIYNFTSDAFFISRAVNQISGGMTYEEKKLEFIDDGTGFTGTGF